MSGRVGGITQWRLRDGCCPAENTTTRGICKKSLEWISSELQNPGDNNIAAIKVQHQSLILTRTMCSTAREKERQARKQVENGCCTEQDAGMVELFVSVISLCARMGSTVMSTFDLGWSQWQRRTKYRCSKNKDSTQHTEAQQLFQYAEQYWKSE